MITGGASGIGEATVRRFVAEGAAGVVVADLDDTRGRALTETLGPPTVFSPCDVTSEADVARAVDLAVHRFDRLDIMFNNAGIGGVQGPIDATDLADLDATWGVLLRGVFAGLKHAARVMKPQRSGNIINNASVGGLRPGLAAHGYSAAKAGVISLTRTVALELARYGIRVNCICPGGIVTPIYAHQAGLSGRPANLLTSLVGKAMASDLPLGRAGTAEDVAAAALYLASDDAAFVTGEYLVVDGGLLIKK